MILEKIGGRKFIVSIGIMIAGIVIDLVTARGLSENLMYLLMAGATGFGVVNVGGHFVNAKKEEVKAKKGRPPETKVKIDAKEIEAKIEPIQKSLTALSNRQAADSQTLNQVASIIVALASQPQQGGPNAE